MPSMSMTSRRTQTIGLGRISGILGVTKLTLSVGSMSKNTRSHFNKLFRYENHSVERVCCNGF